MNPKDLTRRDFLAKGTMIAVGLTTPKWLSAVASSDLIRLSQGAKLNPDNILIVCQCSGGNDGLNTVVPFTNNKYYQARPNIAIAADTVLKLDNQVGFHPNMTGMETLFKEGKVAVIESVGYPNPNRSHFKSMDIWQSASPEQNLPYGWVGRSMDERIAGSLYNPVCCVGLSTERPLALTAKDAAIPCFASLADIQSMVGDPNSEALLRQIQGSQADQGTAVRTIQDANKAALDAMTELNSRLKGVAPKQTYGETSFGRGFKQIAQLVMASPNTRVIYLSVGGFDNHANQPEAHGKLLKDLSDALLAFQREMEATGKDKNVTVLVFSEFGRRVNENGSKGSDHGEGAPMFLVGSRVKGGFHGVRPDLNTLSNGDVPWKIDFRQVYAATLEDWLGNDTQLVLGKQFGALDVIK